MPVLAGLVCASLTEDRYGVVQRDIPRILEAFVSFLTALEEYQLEVTKLYVPPTPDEVFQGEPRVLKEKERTRIEVAKATEAIGIIADGAFRFVLLYRTVLPSRAADVWLSITVRRGRRRADIWREARRVQVPTTNRTEAAVVCRLRVMLIGIAVISLLANTRCRRSFPPPQSSKTDGAFRPIRRTCMPIPTTVQENIQGLPFTGSVEAFCLLVPSIGHDAFIHALAKAAVGTAIAARPAQTGVLPASGADIACVADANGVHKRVVPNCGSRRTVGNP